MIQGLKLQINRSWGFKEVKYCYWKPQVEVIEGVREAALKLETESSYSTYQSQSDVINVKCTTCPANTFITDDRKKSTVHEVIGDCVGCKV